MGTKSPLGVLQPRLPGAPRSESRDWSVLRRETPERTSEEDELAKARTRDRLESWDGVKDEMKWILSVVTSMAYMEEGCIVGGERCAELLVAAATSIYVLRRCTEERLAFGLALVHGCAAEIYLRFGHLFTFHR